VLAAGLSLTGIPAGVLWWLLAPRVDFRITTDGPVPIGNPPTELSVADDSIYVLILAGLGLLAGAGAWALRRRRGVATPAALAVGLGLAAVGAWVLGELLGPRPTEAQLAEVDAVVTTPLTLNALPALAVGPFVAVLAYLVAVLVARTDDLGRTQPTPVLVPGERADPGLGITTRGEALG
jgi:LPXTG-motif cell wall-anchored protein